VKATRRLLAAVAALAALPLAAAAQPEVDLGGYLHETTLLDPVGETRLRQWVVPVQVRLPALGGAFDVSTAMVRVSAEGRQTGTLSGPTDTQFTGTWAVGHWALLSIRAQVPTGGREFGAESTDLVGTLSRHDLGLPVRSYGTGPEAAAGFTLCRQLDPFGLTLGFGHVRRWPYSPLAGVDGYRSGDEVSVALGVDYAWRRWVLRLGAAGWLQAADRLGGEAVFQNGKRALVQVRVHYEGRSFRLEAEASEILRLKNRVLSDGTLLYETRDSNGNDLRVHLGAGWSPHRFVTLHGSARLKQLTANAYQPGDPLYQGRARVWGGGAGLSFALADRGRLLFHYSRLEGSAADRTELFTSSESRISLRLKL